jgi:hypothetical protein
MALTKVSRGLLSTGIVDNSNATAITIDSSENVGVGTSSPSYKADILATNQLALRLNTTDANGCFLAIQTNGTAKGYLGSSHHLVAGSPSENDITLRAENNLQFTTGGGTERMRIGSDGTLSVGGVFNAGLSDNGFFVSGTDGSNVYSINSSTSSSTYHVYDNGGAAFKFFVTYAGTINATGTTISGISDIRWKENIRDLDDGLSKVMQLQPRKFDWKKGKGKDVSNDRGFIAQEFETVFPDLIDDWIDPAPEGEEPYKAVRADLIPTLVKAIQEQQAIIESQAAAITDLTTRLTALENN